MLGPQENVVQLEGLIEVTLPAPVGNGPETLGWYILFGLMALAAIWIGYRFFHRHRANRYRRWALTRLENVEQVLEQDWALDEALSEIPVLVKRTALHCYPREKVASLSGDDWLRFLDASCGGTDFSDGAGQLVARLAYQPAAPLENCSREDIRQLVAVVRRWIKKHRGEP